MKLHRPLVKSLILLFCTFVIFVLTGPILPAQAGLNGSVIIFQTPDESGAVETTSPSIQITGLLRSPGTPLVSLIWDNVNTKEAGFIFENQALLEQQDWHTDLIKLKPGKNEIFFTAYDVEGRTYTNTFNVYRKIGHPSITKIYTPLKDIPVYTKQEIVFDLETVAEQYFYAFDDAPPSGVVPRTGVTVEAQIKSPSGRILKQPAFYYEYVSRLEKDGLTHFSKTDQGKWVVRFTPQEPGLYDVNLYVQDASGTVQMSVGTFTAFPSSEKGFIRVSQVDTRYFEYSNGELHFPIGPVNGTDLERFAGSGLNISRQWLAGTGAYSTNFARWMSSAQQMGNEGFDSRLTYEDHFPSHELSQEIFFPEGRHMWMGWLQGEPYRPILLPGHTYLVKTRIKLTGLTGPEDPSKDYGLVIKNAGWPENTYLVDFQELPSLIPPVRTDRDWHTILARYTVPQEQGSPAPYLHIYLDNVTGGKVYVDELSIREIMPNGKLGGEQIVNSSADLFSYVEPGPASYIDWIVRQGEANGVAFKFVVQDKRDWIYEHLNSAGEFVEQGNGYYQSEKTRAGWLQRQWWRYLIARWGYSPAIHSWEFNNEGSPDDPMHYQAAQNFASFMHQNDPHPHLVTTSFWSDWRPAFWGNANDYPEIDYADIHMYLHDNNAIYNFPDWYMNTGGDLYTDNINKPIMFGEIGFGSPGENIYELLSQSKNGLWYHDLLWSQLSPAAVSNPNYWWTDHLNQINQVAVSRPFSLFVSKLPLNKGGYQDPSIQTDNPLILATGQVNGSTGAGYFWIKNLTHTLQNVLGDDQISPIPQDAIMTFTAPLGQYAVEWWDTSSGKVIRTETINVDGSQIARIRIDGLETDAALTMKRK